MAGSINKATVLGYVGKEPEIRTGQAGQTIATFTLATAERWKDKQTGEDREVTEWHRIVVFNERIAEVVRKYVHKGSLLHVEGQLKTRKWTDQAGADRWTTEIVLSSFRGELTLVGPKPDQGGASSAGHASGPAPVHGRSSSEAATHRDYAAEGRELDDDIPF